MEPEHTRRALYARRYLEPLVRWLDGREVIYYGPFVAIVRLSFVRCDSEDFGLRSIPTVPLRTPESRQPAPTEPWELNAAWTSVRTHRGELSFHEKETSWMISWDPHFIRRMYSCLCLPGDQVAGSLHLRLASLASHQERAPVGFDTSESRRGSNTAAWWYIRFDGELIVCTFMPGGDRASRNYKLVSPFEQLSQTTMYFFDADESENLNEFAFTALLEEPDARRMCLRLMTGNYNPAAMLYGLRGILSFDKSGWKQLRLGKFAAEQFVRVKRPDRHWWWERIDRVALEVIRRNIASVSSPVRCSQRA